jgi:predicted Zn-dependent peptidase
MAVDRSRLPDVRDGGTFAFPRIAHHRLANGLAVRTVEHRSAPVVTFVLVTEGGAGADPQGQEGLMALTADMVDEGTGSLNALDVSDALARIGADYDVDVGADATIFALTTLSRFAERGASLLADLTTRPALHERDFQRVKQLRLDRLRQLKDLAPATAERVFLKVLYGSHPYGHLSIGAESSLVPLTRDDVERAHRDAYTPDRSTLVVSGPLDHDALAAVAASAFGGWESGVPGERPPNGASELPVPERPSVRLAVVPREAAAQSELRIGHLSARRRTPDYAALLVMNAVMGGQFVSRINLKLREEKGFTYGARTGFDWRRGPAPFVLQASVHTAATAEAVRDSLQELEAIRSSRPASEEELFLAKASLTRGYPRNFETTQQVARSVAQLALFGLPDTYFEEFVPKVQAITAADVSRVASTYLDPGKAATLIVGDHAAIASTLDTIGLGTAEILSPGFS